MINIVDTYSSFLDLKEPRSNRGLEQFKSKEEYEHEKEASKAKAE